MPNSQQHPNVYIVDDDLDLVEELAEFVGRHGFTVKHFHKPETALRAMSIQRAPFIVVTDVMMPGMSGHELLKRLKRQAVGTAPYEVIMMSGQAEFDDAVKAMELGVLDFLPKPVDAKALVQAIGLAAETLAERMRTDRRVGLLEAKLAETAKATLNMAENIRGLLGGDKLDAGTAGTSRSAPARQPSAQLHVIDKAPANPAPPKAVAPKGKIEMSEPHEMLAVIKLMQSIKRVRDKHFSECAQGDAEWEIILYVIEQDLLHRPVSVTSACHASLIPQTTAMRKIDELVASGVLERHADPDDRRRILVRPTAQAHARAKEALSGIFTQTLGAMSSETLELAAQSAATPPLQQAAE